MATTSHLGQLHGKVGNLVFYRLNGKNVVRTVQNRYTRTAPMKKWADSFGHGSQLSALIRKQLGFLYDYHDDLVDLQQRLNGNISRWLHKQAPDEPLTSESFDFLCGTGITTAPFTDMKWKQKFELVKDASNELHFSVNEFKPLTERETIKGAWRLIYTVAAISFDWKDQRLKKTFRTAFDLKLTDPPVPSQLLRMNIKPSPGDLTIAMASVSVLNGGDKLMTKGKRVFEAGEVFGVVYG